MVCVRQNYNPRESFKNSVLNPPIVMTEEDGNGYKSAGQVQEREIILFYSTGSLKITKSILTKIKRSLPIFN